MNNLDASYLYTAGIYETIYLENVKYNVQRIILNMNNNNK